jgi:hypothetical protein
MIFGGSEMKEMKSKNAEGGGSISSKILGEGDYNRECFSWGE